MKIAPKEKILAGIKKKFRTDDVGRIVIDDEFGNVTATVRGIPFTDCGFVEDYA